MSEKELIIDDGKLFCFEQYFRTGQATHVEIYMANPKNRWKKSEFNDKLIQGFFNRHSLTFKELKTETYGKFYYLSVYSNMELWGKNLLENFKLTNPEFSFRYPYNYKQHEIYGKPIDEQHIDEVGRNNWVL